MDHVDSGIGPRVRAARERLDWSRETLAVHSGISWSAIAQVESGRRTNLRPATLDALAGALGLTIDYLVRGSLPDRPMCEHTALLYGDEAGYLEVAGPFLAAAVERSEPALVVTRKAHIALLRDHLGQAADSVEFVEARKWYSAPAAALGAHRAFIESRVAEGAPWVRMLGEPVWEWRAAEEERLWARFEALLNLVFSGAPATILCSYDTRSAPEDAVRQAYATHPKTISSGPGGGGDGYADPAGFMLEPPA